MDKVIDMDDDVVATISPNNRWVTDKPEGATT